MLTNSTHPTIERACTPMFVRALQRVGIYSTCGIARRNAKRALGIVPSYETRGMHLDWQSNPLTVDLGPLAAGPQLWSEHHDG